MSTDGVSAARWARWRSSRRVGEDETYGSSGTDAAESALLQERLGAFAQVGAVLSLTFYLLVNSVARIGDGVGAYPWLGGPNLLVLAIGGLLAVLWAVCRGRQRPPRVLHTLDAVFVVATCAATSIYAWLGDTFEAFKLNAILVPANVLTFRAILVPSRPTRTTWIGALAVAPAAAVPWLTWLLADDPTPHLQDRAALFTAWSVVTVALSTVVSSVVYGLRNTVRKARRLGQYQLEEKIGEGGMGTVYRARHAMLRRPTAIKVLRPDRAGGVVIAYFEREVQLTSGLTHPNTIAIYDYGRTGDGLFYYAMELLDGLDLDRLVARHGPFPPGLVIHVLRQVCGALTEAHGRGLIHRDIKAANLILCERGGVPDVVKVLDFGLVRELETEAPGDARICGTPAYLAPEAITSPERTDARTDLYAVGVLGYYLLTGVHPFEGRGALDLLTAHVSEVPKPPSSHCPVPSDLEAAVLSCLAKDPDQRPASAQALGQLLDACGVATPWTPGEWSPARQSDDDPTQTTTESGRTTAPTRNHALGLASTMLEVDVER